MANTKDEVVGIRVPLTAEQKRAIHEATGKQAEELLVVGEADGGASHQVGTYLDQAIVRRLWAENDTLQELVARKGAGDARSQWKKSGDYQPPPRLVLIR